MNQSRYRNNTPWEKMSFPAIIKETWQKINPFATSKVAGSQRPLGGLIYSGEDTIYDRNFDLEVQEIPVRDYQTARELIHFKENCSLAATAVRITLDRLDSSSDGDDVGYIVSKFLGDGTPVDPEVYRIINNLITEVIGGDALQRAPHQMLYYGDAFASIGINWSSRQIERIMFLPTWEMFRVETNDKMLWGFEQRHHLSDSSGIKFHPVECIHWRHQPDQIYGISQYYESRKDWLFLLELQQNLRDAAKALAHNPLVHQLPCDYGQTAIKDYRDAYQDRLKKGIITDFFLQNDADIKRLSNFNPDLAGILQAIDHVLYQIARQSQVPPWLLGLPAIGAREISYAPERHFALFLNKRRAELTRGIRYLCDLELMLHGIKNAKYRIIWPRLYVPHTFGQMNPEYDEMNTEDQNILDLDKAAKKQAKELAIASQSKNSRFIQESERFQEVESPIDSRRRITARALSDFQNQQQELYKKRYA